jgi:hypothetical protein
MWIEETRWDHAGWRVQAGIHNDTADLVIYFGNREALRCGARYDELRSAYPGAKIIGCSATRSIVGDALEEDGIVAVALGFAHTSIRLAHSQVTESAQSRAGGATIGKALAGKDLARVFVLADGLRVDGSELTAGLCDSIGTGPLIIGGMASDPCDYTETLVGANCLPQSGMIAAVGFYGDAIRFTHGRASGWDAFGPRRHITRSIGNVLYELDGKPAFELYQRYLGEEASAGIRAGVLFPLQTSPPEHPERMVVRALLGVDERTGSMTFAGHMQEGWSARLMRGNLDRLILAAGDAARQACIEQPPAGSGESLALMVSCTGRQLLMGQRTEEELEVAGAELGSQAKRIGFYSYGEIAPMSYAGISDLHNQTMTITSLTEVGN